MPLPDRRYNAIYQVLALIPAGRVATYGQVAALAGLGRGARMVGRTLKLLPADSQLPWHRVVNSRGMISLPDTSPEYAVQKQKLQEEGIVFSTDRINLRLFGWNPGGEA